MTPVVSVVVPVYNSAQTIKRCVKSILAQTIVDWELLLVDNGSSDNSLELIRELAETDKRIRILRELNPGVARARNAALDVAYGENVCFVDSDDEVENDYLEQLIQNPNADLTVCGYFVDVETRNGEKINSEAFTTGSVNWNNPESKSILVPAFEKGFMHLCCNKLFRRDIIEHNHIRFKHYPVNEDYIFTLTFLQYADSVSIVNRPLYHWIRIEGNVSGVKSIPDNLLDIYNESHLATRKFLDANSIADSIAYLSYEMIVYKYYEAIRAGRMSTQEAFNALKALTRNSLVKDAYKSYSPNSVGEKLLYLLMRAGLYKAHYFLTQKI